MAPKTGNINAVLVGRGPLTIRPGDYVATGGEGSIYMAGNTIIKIYTDPKKMRQDGMLDKIKLLSALKHKFITAPEGVVTDSKDNPIGYYMPFAEGEPLSGVFTNAFRQRHKFGDKEAIILVDNMREAMRFAHDHKAIMVDPNELNWKVNLQGPEPRVFDVDSWAIGRWPATVIMPSIRDWNAKKFDEASDWFAWGIITFQVFTGIHPYKGSLPGYGRYDLEKRMKANASVFLPDVDLNSAVRDFNCIPGPLLDWYRGTFQKGERNIPPSPFDKTIVRTAPVTRIHRTVVSATGALLFDLLFEKVNDPVVRLWPCGIVLCASGDLVDLNSKKVIAKAASSYAEVVKVKNGWLYADRVNGKLTFCHIDDRTNQQTRLDFNVRGHHILRYENRLFLVTENELIELNFVLIGRPILSVGQRNQILQPKATHWFDGVGIQEALGATFIVAPFGDKSCLTVRVRELDGLTPVTAKAGNRFICIVAIDKAGDYHKLSFYFSNDYSSYNLTREKVDNAEINLCILPKGVCATVITDGELEIFVPSNGQVRKVQDKMITTTITLANLDDRVVYLGNGQVWSVRVR